MDEQEAPLPTSPEIRVWTFGRFLVERLVSGTKTHEGMEHYEVVPNDAWRGRGSGRRLLRFLLCRGGYRRAGREVLLEELWPRAGEQEVNAGACLNTATHAVRSILQLSGNGPLLTIERTPETTIYTLADQRRVWVDVDAFDSLMEQAAVAERQGADPLPSLERAHRLAQGEFLEDEHYSEWAQIRRREIEAARHRCIHRLAMLYSKRGLGDQAETLLQQVLFQNPRDEDVLCRLMVLLAQQRRHQEALRHYRRTVRELQETVQRQPGKRLRELADRLRQEPVLVERQAPQSIVLRPGVSPGQPKEIWLSRTEQEMPEGEQGAFVLPGILQGIPTDDPGVYYGLLHPYISDLICRWENRKESFHDLQASIDNEIRRLSTMESSLPRSEQDAQKWRMSRRQALVALAALPVSLLFHIQQEETSAVAAQELLPRCAASLAACWQLSKGPDIVVVEQLIPHYLPKLQRVVEQASPYQKEAARLTSQGHQLAGIVALQRNQLDAREAHCKAAVEYSQVAEDRHLQVAALILLAGTYYHSKYPLKTLQTYQEASLYVDEVTPLLQARVYLGLAHAYASCGQEKEALRYLGLARETFPEHPERDPSSFFADSGRSSLSLWEGRMYLELSQYQEAYKAFALMEKGSEPHTAFDRTQLAIINHQAEAAIGMRELDIFCHYVGIGQGGAKALGSEKRYMETFDIYKQGRRVWPYEPRVKALGELFVR